MIDGRIGVAEIPSEWDQKMKDYLHIDTAGDYRDGCLQDVHWPSGLFGYFPSYTLGAMTAAQLFRSAKLSKADLLEQIGEGDFSSLVSWLHEKIHSRGSSVSFDQLLVDASGETLNSDHFIEHLQTRYLEDR